MDAHDLNPADRYEYDIIVTTETLEHDPRPEHLIQVAWDMLKPGGWLVLTAASTNRPPHSVNGDQAFQEGEHYANIDPAHLRDWLRDWQYVDIEYAPYPGDVYCIAQKPHEPHI